MLAFDLYTSAAEWSQKRTLVRLSADQQSIQIIGCLSRLLRTNGTDLCLNLSWTNFFFLFQHHECSFKWNGFHHFFCVEYSAMFNRLFHELSGLSLRLSPKDSFCCVYFACFESHISMRSVTPKSYARHRPWSRLWFSAVLFLEYYSDFCRSTKL